MKLSALLLYTRRLPTGEWTVWTYPNTRTIRGKSRQVAGPFDHEADAKAWMVENGL